MWRSCRYGRPLKQARSNLAARTVDRGGAADTGRAHSGYAVPLLARTCIRAPERRMGRMAGSVRVAGQAQHQVVRARSDRRHTRCTAHVRSGHATTVPALKAGDLWHAIAMRLRHPRGIPPGWWCPARPDRVHRPTDTECGRTSIANRFDDGHAVRTGPRAPG